MVNQSNVFVGIKPNGDDASAGLPHKKLETYDYVLLPLTNARYRDSAKRQFDLYRSRDTRSNQLRLEAPKLKEVGIPPSVASWGEISYIGLVSSFLELESDDADVRTLSTQVLKHELEYANFVGIKQVILAPPRKLTTLHYYAQCLANVFEYFAEKCPTISISLPLFEDSDPLSTWELWNTIRKLCDYHPKLCISLALPRQKTPSYVLSRWLSEPVTCLLISASVFTFNQYNFPVLNKFNQSIVAEFQKINGNASSFGELVIILHGMEKHVEKHKIFPSNYLEYINYCLKKSDMIVSPNNDTMNDLLPRIMPPLLPHHNNLSNEVYHTFEKDSVKYDLYEKAIKAALLELLNDTPNDQSTKSMNFVILVAGAGRGPLVDKTFNVLNELGIVNFKLLAIEKNPHALLYLEKRNFEHWSNKVEIFNADIRNWDKNTKVDVCISELLGSFGCNELAPECINSIEKYHSKPTTKFIPQSYSSLALPVSSPILYQTLKQKGEKYLQTPCIAHNVPFCKASSRVNELWKFSHGFHGVLESNKASISTFRIKNKVEIHGIAGFFIATLFKDVQISIVPRDSVIKSLKEQDFSTVEPQTGNASPRLKGGHTENMKSWSPIFFPLEEPLFVNDDTEIEMFMARSHSGGEVWYEWGLSSFIYLVVNSSSKMDDKNRVSSVQSTDKKDYQTNDLNEAFAKFAPSCPQDFANARTNYFEDSANQTDFLSRKGDEWTSVHDLHNLQNANAHVFEELDASMSSKEKSFFEEYHVRVRTGTTKLHNVNGTYYSIPLL